MAHMKFRSASPSTSWRSEVRGSNEYPRPPCPMSSSAVRAIQWNMSTSAFPSFAFTREEIASPSCTREHKDSCESGHRCTYLSGDAVENRSHVPHVLRGEYGVQ